MVILLDSTPLKEAKMKQVALKDFIKSALVEIAAGIKGANDELNYISN